MLNLIKIYTLFWKMLKYKILPILEPVLKVDIREEVLGKTKSSTAAYFWVREERRRVLTTKLPLISTDLTGSKPMLREAIQSQIIL